MAYRLKSVRYQVSHLGNGFPKRECYSECAMVTGSFPRIVLVTSLTVANRNENLFDGLTNVELLENSNMYVLELGTPKRQIAIGQN